MQKCEMSRCDKKHKALGYCNMHYRRFLKHGDPSIEKKPGGQSRKLSFDIRDFGCFIPTSYRETKKGYIHVVKNKKIYSLHRFIYEECFGEIPQGFVVRHKCDNPKCINPEHLELGTPKENSLDMVKRGRSLKGSKNKKAKLNEEKVKIIKHLLKTEKIVDISNQFNVSPVTISHIKTGRTWSHV